MVINATHCTHPHAYTFPQQHLTSCSLMEADSLRHTSLCLSNTHRRTITPSPSLFFFSLMEPDPWEWQPARYASVAIPHKAMRQGRGAARPPTPSAFHPTSVKRRYTLLRVSPLFLYISLSYICILCVPLPLNPFLQGIKSNLRLFLKTLLKPSSQVRTFFFTISTWF